LRAEELFRILGLTPCAGWEEIRRAYRRRVKELHPDRGGDAESYLRLQEAYEELRRRYAQGQRVQVLRERPGHGDYFHSFVELTVREAALGTEKVVRVPEEPVPCSYCGGGGRDPCGPKVRCEVCGGRGLVLEEGPYRSLCPRCRGEGEIRLSPCPQCRGRGEIRGEKEILLHIPPGVREGDLLFVPRSPGGPGIDVYLEVLLRREDGLYFEGEDLVLRVRVPFWKAALGGRLQVETLEGPEEIELPRGLPSGARLILNQRGPFKLDGRRGNLILQFEVWFPEDYPQRALKLLEEFYSLMEEAYGGTTRAQ